MTTLCINPQCPEPENADDRDRCRACNSRLLLGQRFRPIVLLGQGGFGRTFLAWDEGTSPPQRCVIKQILRTRDNRDRVLAEADRLARLGRNPQIPELIAILDSDRDTCIVQEHIPGRNLEQVLAAEGAFDEPQVRSLLVALLPVLQFIHDHNIIHRDIKPENILLPGGDALPVLVDFGAARTALTATELQRTGTVIGSAAYAAPEQALGKAVPASDLYGLGVTCLHLLTGEHPFELYSVAEDRWVWEPFVVHAVSPSLARVLNRLVVQSLRSRYPRADLALADLAPAGILVARSPTAPRVRVTAKSWHCVRIWSTSGKTANALAISPDSQLLATANSDNSVQLWNYATGTLQQTLAQRFGFGEGHTDAVTAVQFHPQERILYTGSQDSTVKQWTLHTGRLQRSVLSGWPVTAIALSPNGEIVVVATDDGHITMWAASTGHRLAELVRHTGAVNALSISPEGTRLISVGEEGTLRLWTLPDGQLLHTWTASTGIRTVALDSADPALITGSANGQVTMWSLYDFDRQTDLSRHQDAVSATVLSPDGRLLATASRDREIHLWDWVSTPKQRLAVLYHDWAVCDLAFTPDSQTLISSAADETIRFWQAAS